MARTADPEIQQRNVEIGRLWIEGSSTREIATQYGLELQSIRKILRSQGLKEKDRKRLPKRKSLYERRPISNLHSQIGNDIAVRRTTELEKNIEQFAKMVGISRQRMKEIEAGVHEITLGELIKVSQVIGVPPENLIKDRRSWAAN